MTCSGRSGTRGQTVRQTYWFSQPYWTEDPNAVKQHFWMSWKPVSLLHGIFTRFGTLFHLRALQRENCNFTLFGNPELTDWIAAAGKYCKPAKLQVSRGFGSPVNVSLVFSLWTGGSIKVPTPTTEHRTGFTRAVTGTETTWICLTFIKMQTSQGVWLIYK